MEVSNRTKFEVVCINRLVTVKVTEYEAGNINNLFGITAIELVSGNLTLRKLEIWEVMLIEVLHLRIGN